MAVTLLKTLFFTLYQWYMLLVENVHGHIYNELKKINLTKKNIW